MDNFNFSTFTAISELFVTAGVFYVVLRNYRGQGFAWKLAATIIAFEFSVNMMYMIFRMREHSTAGAEGASAALVPLMAAHGILSLLVFILLVVFSYLAYVGMRRGQHFFREHPGITWSFIALWLLSVGSGEVLYLINYH